MRSKQSLAQAHRTDIVYSTGRTSRGAALPETVLEPPKYKLGCDNSAVPEPTVNRAAHKCDGEMVKLVCPVGWPMLTVALVCWECGFVFEYIDNFQMMSEILKETGRKPKDNPLKPFAITSRGIAHQNSMLDETDNRLLQMLTDGRLVKDVAIELNLPPDYVHAMGRLSHII